MRPLVLRHLGTAGILAALLAATTGCAFLPLGILNWIVALVFSFAMTFVIMFYFMQLRRSEPLIWMAAAVGFLWLAILLVLASMDYLSRAWPR